MARTAQLPNVRGPVSIVLLSVGATWNNMPSALTEFNGATSGRLAVDLSAYTKARLSANVGAVAGATGANLRAQYSVDLGSTWAYLDGSAGPSALVDDDASTVHGAWVTIAAAAQGEVLVRLAGITGDGAIDPVIGAVYLQLAA